MHATSLKLQNDQSSISTRSQKRRTSRIAWILILLILPVYILTLVVYPVLAITSLVSFPSRRELQTRFKQYQPPGHQLTSLDTHS